MFTQFLKTIAALALLCTVLSCNSALGWDSASLETNLDASSGPDEKIKCDTYCAIITKNCAGINAQYGSVSVCLDMCNQIEPGFQGETNTNTVACRQYHATAAATNAEFHCSHAGPLGGEVCGGRCDGFCLLDMALCRNQSPPPYSSDSACRQACAQFPFDESAGELGLQSGNSLNCRLYHLESAYGFSAEMHCPHTAVISDTCN